MATAGIERSIIRMLKMSSQTLGPQQNIAVRPKLIFLNSSIEKIHFVGCNNQYIYIRSLDTELL